jgi:hypothetical protein
MKPNNFIVLGQNGGSYYVGLLDDKTSTKDNKITNKAYRGIIKIKNNIAVLTSNSEIPEGEDQLIFYNISKKSISNIIEGYSFTISTNGLAIIPREKDESKNKILLATCKQYQKNQKNGIALLNPQLGDNRRVNKEFYDLGTFEPYCICPILTVKNKNDNYININEEYRKNIDIQDTNYFFVGGFNNEKREGQIKLFQVLFKKKAFDTEIKFIQDIVLEDNINDYFDGPISCILQSHITGHILITCYNEKVYLFTPPNMEFYLKNKHEGTELGKNKISDDLR